MMDNSEMIKIDHGKEQKKQRNDSESEIQDQLDDKNLEGQELKYEIQNQIVNQHHIIQQNIHIRSDCIPNEQNGEMISLQKPKILQEQEGLLSKLKIQLIKRNRIIVFVMTYLAYASIHATRTAWSSSKQSLKQELYETDDKFLGLVDTCFLLSYAISMKFLGSYSNNFRIQYFLGFGMVGASVCLLFIYFVSQVRVDKLFILIMMILNGICQSTGWPSVVACMGNWFGNGNKGFLMGIWGTSSNFGNMIGYFAQDFAVNTLLLNWKFVLFIVGLLLLVVGSIVIFHLQPYPQQIGVSNNDFQMYEISELKNNRQKQNEGHVELSEDFDQQDNKQYKYNRRQSIVLSMPLSKQIDLPNNEAHILKSPREEFIPSSPISNTDSQKTVDINQFSASKQPQENTNNDRIISQSKLNIFNAWVRIPGLAVFALTQGGIKSTIYGIMFWLPIYLQEKDLKNYAAFICSMSEIGTFGGGVLLGYLIDRFERRALIITCFLGVSSIFFFVIHFLPASQPIPYFVFVLLAGVSLGGPYTMLGGAIAIDLAQQPEAKLYNTSTAMLAGFIEGFSSFVAAIVQIIIPLCGQEYIFLLFTISTLFSSFFLLPKALNELKNALISL